MAGWFELSKGGDGMFRFVLKSGNAQTILTSEGYKTKKSAENGIASVQKNCVNDANYERKESANAKPFFILKAANRQIIGTSQMYANVKTIETGIASVKSNGTTQIIKDKTNE